jgi:hypothetical protein
MMNDGSARRVVWDQARWGCIIANSMKAFFVMLLAKNSKDLSKTFLELSACLNRFLKKPDATAPEGK